MHLVFNKQCLKIDAAHYYDNNCSLREETPCQLVWFYAWYEICMSTAGDSSLISFMLVKDQVLGNVFGRTFSGSFWQSLSPPPHCPDILLSTSCQIWNFLPSYFLGGGYWPCSLKFVYPMINLPLLWIIVKVKLPVKFCLLSFDWFCLQISCDAKYFSSLVQGIVIKD